VRPRTILVLLLAAFAFLGAYAVSGAVGSEDGESPSRPPAQIRTEPAAPVPPPLAAGAPLPALRREPPKARRPDPEPPAPAVAPQPDPPPEPRAQEPPEPQSTPQPSPPPPPAPKPAPKKFHLEG
jgi:protein TonB